MSHTNNGFSVHSSAITDRGLNERRPLNEDSFLADNERRVFAVADGVGGAEAGEVASQTAVEVLDEAFRHQVDGADIEDLMELAIQRANASIHQMAQDHAKFSMMATTIVALHLQGQTATIGHVGDSRLYRLTPDGQLLRETEDHSVVEEEVRAGRMTPEQAANHPSKNVISRALGAEDDVEVDMKTIEVEDGTEFLLCTDGITRHIPDYEIRQLLIVNDDLGEVCTELKRRCFERGAEDNLTAVLVRVGNPIPADQRSEELERTISPETEAIHVPVAAAPADAEATATPAVNANPETPQFVPPSRIAFPGTPTTETAAIPSQPLNIDAPSRSGGASMLGRALIFLIVLGAIAGAFIAGRRYDGPIPFVSQTKATTETVPAVEPTPSPTDQALMKFETSRRELDRNPADWLAKQLPGGLAEQNIQNPLDSINPQFLYLYGRASLLTGNYEAAARAFEAAIARAKTDPTSENQTVVKEATLALAATTLKSEKERNQALTHFDEMLPKPATSSSP
ncbi:MAG TPA: PP2C family serine/threonine-protein phosphatase [Pyrinomonadaceae bacterium]